MRIHCWWHCWRSVGRLFADWCDVTTVVTRFWSAGSTTPLDVAKTRIMLETVEEGVKLLVKVKLRVEMMGGT